MKNFWVLPPFFLFLLPLCFLPNLWIREHCKSHTRNWRERERWRGKMNSRTSSTSFQLFFSLWCREQKSSRKKIIGKREREREGGVGGRAWYRNQFCPHKSSRLSPSPPPTVPVQSTFKILLLYTGTSKICYLNTNVSNNKHCKTLVQYINAGRYSKTLENLFDFTMLQIVDIESWL